MNFNSLLILCFICIAFSCSHKTALPSEAFIKTWYAGKAELTSYVLHQARYGQTRQGEAVVIFVTEDFSTSKLVKLDEPEKTSNKARVLKMNLTKSFVTGIYPYSMMLSVFTPVSKKGNAKTMKVACTVQEWCGQTFSSLHWKGRNYSWQLHSYFEKEGDQDKKVGSALPEDELWNLIRIDPSALPQGKVTLIPGLLWQRISHTEMKEEEAVLSVMKADSSFIQDSAAQVFSIHYPIAKRTLRIYFQSAMPHEILGWQETYPDGPGNNKKIMTTTATKKKTVWLDYWNHNKIVDSSYRDSLQLMRYE